MLFFVVGMIVILGSIGFILSLLFKIVYSLYKRYQFINSPEFKAMSNSMSKEEKLRYTYNGLSKLIGILTLVFLGTLLFNLPTWLVLVVLVLLLAVLCYNSQVLTELKKYPSA